MECKEWSNEQKLTKSFEIHEEKLRNFFQISFGFNFKIIATTHKKLHCSSHNDIGAENQYISL